MSSDSGPLATYVLLASQPVRAVVWACLGKGRPFVLHPTGPQNLGRGGSLAALNPAGQVPVIQDAGFTLAEMPAILI